jgi:peptidoglycan hydrolase-like protein with peptidoglycan-binding domain
MSKRSSIGSALGARSALFLCLAAVTAAGCTPVETDEPGGAGDLAPGARLRDLTTDLATGAQGEDVRALQAYLENTGYLPNEELARRHPLWRPIVPERPTPGTYDATTERAVRAFQRNGGLTETGVVDSATRALIRQPRCSFPDGIIPPDPKDKFAVHSFWQKTEITWRRLNNAVNGVSNTQADDAITRAFATWAPKTNLTFKHITSGTPDIGVRFMKNCCMGFRAQAFTPSEAPGTILVESTELWSVATPTPSTRSDFRSVILHEIGHTLGLLHSSVGGKSTVMAGAGAGALNRGEQRRALGTDDRLAISMHYNPWASLPGVSALDVGVGGDGSVWVASKSNVVHKLSGTTWVMDTSYPPALFAVRVAADATGKPWVVSSDGSILHKSSNSPTSGTWSNAGGCARDIGAGPSTDVWVVGCQGSADALILKRNNSTGVWELDPELQLASSITVDDAGIPWMVKSDGTIRVRDSVVLNNGSWVSLPGGARDIGASEFGDTVWTWVIGIFDSDIHVWDDQDAIVASGGAGAPEIHDFLKAAEADVNRISVGPRGPYAVGTDGTVFRLSKAP